jgi:hypothetical protein
MATAIILPIIFLFIFVPSFIKKCRGTLHGNKYKAESSAPQKVTIPGIFCEGTNP